ncbi:blue light receptor, partial [Coelomomyces lativittatus]
MNPTLDAANAIRSYDSNFQLTPNTSLENDTPVQAPVISDLQKDYSFMMNIPAFDPPPQVLFRDAFTHPSKTMYAPLIEKGYKAKPSGPHHPKKLGCYSTSGFDLMGVLARVSTRPSPQVTLGPVDASCAFLVCDLNQPDMPIVYVSESFEKMTGYSIPDIMGRNCRFLQSPEGIVEEGSHRQFCDHNVVISLKKSVQTLQECQHTLINYKKGGEPFINLLTLIPICWEREFEYTHIVGFQIDLVEKPFTVLSRLK